MKIIKQDMLALTDGVLFHQVNCQGIMGGGIAYALAKKFPGLEKEYQDCIAKCIKSVDNERLSGYLTEDGDILCQEQLANDVMLGKTFMWTVPNHKHLKIANVFGQGYISSRWRMTSYDATARAFESLAPKLDKGVPLYFPFKMGCGLGGGEWGIYLAIIEHYFPDAIICQHNV